MLFSKNRGHLHHDEKSLYPIMHMTGTFKEYQKELARKEVESLSELVMVGSSFEQVMEQADNFQTKLNDFSQSLSGVNESAGQFEKVKEDITQTVTQAQEMVEELKDTSANVQESYSAMETTFVQLQDAVKDIQRCMGKIVSIADETNILAINASIEAARAGEQGKGFSVVAEKVRELAKEIKELTDDVDEGVRNVESGASKLSNSIFASQEALGKGFDIVNNTSDSFQKITSAADGASLVQSEISTVIDGSQRELQVLCQFFDEIRVRYQDVVKHIDRASTLGTTKSVMFEDIDNLLSQIPHIIQDTDMKKR